jgi:hypothetical protein
VRPLPVHLCLAQLTFAIDHSGLRDGRRPRSRDARTHGKRRGAYGRREGL